MPTTHTDLAKSIGLLRKRLEKVPPTYLVNDATTLALIDAAREVLVSQDERMAKMTRALREARTALKAAPSTPVTEGALSLVNQALGP